MLGQKGMEGSGLLKIGCGSGSIRMYTMTVQVDATFHEGHFGCVGEGSSGIDSGNLWPVN